jgi:hypothetical protein
MSLPLPKRQLRKQHQAVVRTQWLKALRTQPERQCAGLCRNVPGLPLHQVCAIAMLGEVIYGPAWWQRGHAAMTEHEIGRKAGLSAEQTQRVIRMNDGGGDGWTCKIVRPHTFGEIADLIERWFPPH